jgi:hypothetical protein
MWLATFIFLNLDLAKYKEAIELLEALSVQVNKKPP